MSFKIYGVGAVEHPDKVGETLKIEGLDTDNLRYICDEHATNDEGGGMFAILGSILNYKKILSQQEATTPRQQRCWAAAQAPFLYFEAELMSNHPNAAAAEALIKWCAENPDSGLKVGASIEGGILSRNAQNQKVLDKTLGEGIALTIKPMMPRCSVFPMQDLMKSDRRTAYPKEYVAKLAKSSTDKAFVEITFAQQMNMLQQRVASLTKSAQSIISSMKCHKCAKPTSFFVGSDTPNRCPSCGAGFLMSDLWKSVKKTTKKD